MASSSKAPARLRSFHVALARSIASSRPDSISRAASTAPSMAEASASAIAASEDLRDDDDAPLASAKNRPLGDDPNAAAAGKEDNSAAGMFAYA